MYKLLYFFHNNGTRHHTRINMYKIIICTRHLYCRQMEHISFIFPSYFFKCEQTLTANPKGIPKKSLRSLLSYSNKTAPLIGILQHTANTPISTLWNHKLCAHRKRKKIKIKRIGYFPSQIYALCFTIWFLVDTTIYLAYVKGIRATYIHTLLMLF